MHCKQADSAILKLLLVQGSMGQIYFITKQTYVVITCFCRNMGYVAFTRILSRIAFCHEYALFWFCFVQTFTQTFRIWLRFCADIWTKNWQLRPLVTVSFWMDGCMRTSVRGSDPSNDFSFETISWARGKNMKVVLIYLIVYSSWQWTRKFIKSVQDTARLIWCVQFAVQTFDNCIWFGEKLVWSDHWTWHTGCFC